MYTSVHKMSIRFLKSVRNIYYFCNIIAENRYLMYSRFPDVKYYFGKYKTLLMAEIFFFYPLSTDVIN